MKSNYKKWLTAGLLASGLISSQAYSTGTSGKIQTPTLSIAPIDHLQGTRQKIQISATGLQNIGALQAEIKLDQAISKVVSVSLSQDAINAGLKSSDIVFSDSCNCSVFSFAYADQDGVLASLPDGTALFDVVVDFTTGVPATPGFISAKPNFKLDRIQAQYTTVDKNDHVTTTTTNLQSSFARVRSINPSMTNPNYTGYTADPNNNNTFRVCGGDTLSIPVGTVTPTIEDGYSYKLYINGTRLDSNVVNGKFTYPVGTGGNDLTVQVKLESADVSNTEFALASDVQNFHVYVIPAAAFNGGSSAAFGPLCPQEGLNIGISVSNTDGDFTITQGTAVNGMLDADTFRTSVGANSALNGLVVMVNGCSSVPVDVTVLRQDTTPAEAFHGRDITVYTDLGMSTAHVSAEDIDDNAPGFLDHCDGELTGTTTDYANMDLYSIGTHKLVYSATDKSGNVQTDTLSLTVVKRPSVTFYSDSTVSFSGDSVHIAYKAIFGGEPQSYFLAGSLGLANLVLADSITPFSASSKSPAPASLTLFTMNAVLQDYNGTDALDCDRAYLADYELQFYNTQTQQLDHFDAFDSLGTICITNQRVIEGRVSDFNDNDIANATVKCLGCGTNGTVATTSPDNTGHYRFVVPNSYNPTAISGDYNNLTLPQATLAYRDITPDAVDMADVMLVRQYLVGKSSLNTLNLDLSDVNNDAKVNNSDVINIRQFIVAKRDYFLNNDSTKSRYNLYNAGDVDNANYAVELSGYIHQTRNDLVGMTIGDADFSFRKKKKDAKALTELDLTIAAPVTAGQQKEFMIPVLAGANATAAAYQFTMNWDNTVLQLVDVFDAKNSMVTGTQLADNGLLMLNWVSDDNNEVAFNQGDTLFMVKYKAIGAVGQSSPISISSDVTPSKGFNQNGEVMPIVSNPSSVTVQSTVGIQNLGNGYAISAANPNPFRSNLSIQFTLPVKQQLTISVYGTLGQVVTYTNTYAQGTNSWTLPNAESLPTGTYLIKIQGDGMNQTMKVIKD